MIPELRKEFNARFSEKKYREQIADLEHRCGTKIEFRIAETPVFLTDDFRDKLLQAGQEIVDTILKPGFKELTERAIPDKWRVANENDHPHFIALDLVTERR